MLISEQAHIIFVLSAVPRLGVGTWQRVSGGQGAIAGHLIAVLCGDPSHLVGAGHHSRQLHVGQGVGRVHAASAVVVVVVVAVVVLLAGYVLRGLAALVDRPAVGQSVVGALHAAAKVRHGLEHRVGRVPHVAGVPALGDCGQAGPWMVVEQRR